MVNQDQFEEWCRSSGGVIDSVHPTDNKTVCRGPDYGERESNFFFTHDGKRIYGRIEDPETHIEVNFSVEADGRHYNKPGIPNAGIVFNENEDGEVGFSRN